MIRQTPPPKAAPDSMTACTASREGESFVITIVGDLDFAAVEGAALTSALSSYRSNEPLHVVLDLGAVTFLDSAGLGWLMAVRSAAELASRRVRLRSSAAAVDKVLGMTQLTRYFPAESRPV